MRHSVAALSALRASPPEGEGGRCALRGQPSLPFGHLPQRGREGAARKPSPQPSPVFGGGGRCALRGQPYPPAASRLPPTPVGGEIPACAGMTERRSLIICAPFCTILHHLLVDSGAAVGLFWAFWGRFGRGLGWIGPKWATLLREFEGRAEGLRWARVESWGQGRGWRRVGATGKCHSGRAPPQPSPVFGGGGGMRLGGRHTPRPCGAAPPHLWGAWVRALGAALSALGHLPQKGRGGRRVNPLPSPPPSSGEGADARCGRRRPLCPSGISPGEGEIRAGGCRSRRRGSGTRCRRPPRRVRGPCRGSRRCRRGR